MKAKKDLTGRIGFLSVIGRGEPQGVRQRPTWTCRCVCGTVKDIREDVLMEGRVKSCGCASSKLKRAKMEKRFSLVNKKFGHLWVVWRSGSVKVGESSHSIWTCKCSCGRPDCRKTVDVRGGMLTSDKITSCEQVQA
jgi:hypothetical protein